MSSENNRETIREEDIYDQTIDTSKEMSLQKAIAIFMEEQEKNKPVIERPNVNPKRGIIKILIAVAVVAIVCLVLYLFHIPPAYGLILGALIVVIFAKRTVIWLVLLYQKYAPEQVRASCVFHPTCSNYMILAIKKYGLIIGMIKGIIRLFRCHLPNGGEDYP